MPQLPTPPAVNRRNLLRGGLALTALGAAGALPAAPAWAGGRLTGSRPSFTSGIQSADVTARGGVIWARADQASQMIVEVSTSPSFRNARRVGLARLTGATDFTARVPVNGLPSGTQVFYRVQLASADNPSRLGESLVGTLRTASDRPKDITFLWTGDMCGQGWGINPRTGGMRIYETMRRLRPDFALWSGDTIYADGPLSEKVTLADGSTWYNLVAPGKEKVCETLDEFRGAFRYNLLDENLRAFSREVSWLYQWDDHETHNNWYPGQILTDANYTEKRVDVLSARARQAFGEYAPLSNASPDRNGRIYRKISYGPLLDVFLLDMRSHKNPNPVGQTDPAGVAILGDEQVAWLIKGLAQSRATWKVIANDLPLGIVVPDNGGIEGVAQGDNGAPLGREVEFAKILSSIKRNRVRNTVWLTADVHYTAALHYAPERAPAFKDFDPFWEFVSGPANAGTFGPNAIDSTFGTEIVFQKVPPAGQSNLSPSAGYQFFGEVTIDAWSKAFTVNLRDLTGAILHSTTIPAATH